MQLTFVVYSGSGAVAFDEFKVDTSANCSARYMCDFESGPCDWQPNLKTHNYEFSLVSASDGSMPNSDNYDHTTETSSGHYMMAYNGGDVLC